MRSIGGQILRLAGLGLGGSGVALPLLPATPLMLLAAFCVARPSSALHGRLRKLGFAKAIRDWRANSAVSLRCKAASMLAMALSRVLSAALGIRLALVALVGRQALALSGAAVFVLSRSTAA